MSSPNPSNSIQAYLPVDFQLPDEEDKMREMINDRERLTADTMNVREIALYQISGFEPGTTTVQNGELLDGQQWYTQPPPNTEKQSQYGYRSGFDLVALNGGVSIPADGAPHSFNHGLSAGGGTFTFTRIFGTATKAGPVFMPLPYASPTLNLNIEISVTNTQITITVGGGQTALTQCYVVLEYLKA